MFATRRVVSAAAVLALCSLVVACGDDTGTVGGVVVVDVGADVVALPDAETADAAADSVVAADIAADATADAGGDAAADAGTDAIALETTDAADDAATDATMDAATDAGVAETQDDAEVAGTDVADDADAVTDAATPDDADAATDAVDDAVDAETDASDSADAVDAPDAADVPVVAKCASSADCGGDTPYCAAAGVCVACIYNAECPGVGALCVNNACNTPINCVSDKDCTPIGAVCDTGAGVCRECLSVKDCSAGQMCKANQCMPLTACQSSKECPGSLVCAAGQCVECGADTDCLGSQFCSQNLCLQDACKPGAHCEFNAIATCKPNGGGWDYTDCGLTSLCLGAKCEPVVCMPLEIGCKDGNLATCNDTGTQQTLTACPGTQTCVGKACADVICTAKATKCDGNGGLLTCSDDGTQWLGSACADGYACAGGACDPQICAVGTTMCSGQKLLACTAFGLAWSVTATCTDTGFVCVKDKCVAPVCTPASLKCESGVLSVCNGDSMGWSAMSCDDNDACTTDSCDGGTATCTHTAVNCDDGNSCTLDSCSGACQHAGVTGPSCEDGNPCTTGETCSAGKCGAPIASANVTTVAGSGAVGGTNGAGSSASFNRPYGMARMLDGSMVVTEYDSHRLRQVQVDGTVSTLAGTGSSGSQDGAVAIATFANPTSVAVDASGTLFIADYSNNRIRSLSGGNVATFAGSTAGFKDGVGTAAQFTSVQDIKFDVNGVLWAADRGNHRIRRITPDGAVTTAAGTGVAGYLDGAASKAQFNEPCRIAPAADGSIYIADCSNYRIRKLSADGLTVTTVSGSGNGYIDGAGASAKFAWIGGLAWLGTTLIVSDNGNNRIRAVASDGSVSTLAGSGSAAYIDGAPTSAGFSAQWNVVPDWTGAVWIADGTNQRIRKLAFSNLLCNDGNPCTTDSCSNKACSFTPLVQGAACSDGSACTTGDACSAGGKCVGAGTTCSDGNVCTVDSCNPVTGNCQYLPADGPCVDNNVCTNGEHCVSGACLADVNTLSTVAGSATASYVDGAGKDARFNAAFGLAPTKNGGTYVSDATGNRIRFVAADGTTTTVAGSGTAGYLDGAASTAQFNNPTRLALDGQGALLIADAVNNRIRKLSGTTVSTVAGSGTTGFLDGAPTSAQFSSPFGLVYTASGLVYVADSGNHRIRTIASDGTVGTLTGNGTTGNTDGTLANATFSSPRGLCQASDGTLYVVDTLNHNVRRIASGQVSTLAGSGTSGAQDGIGKAAAFYQPRDCTVDGAGNVYVTDTFNNRLRKITPSGVVTTVAGMTIGGGTTLTGTDGSALASVLAYPAVPAWTPGGTIWLADNNAIRKFIPANVDCSDGQPCTLDVCNGTNGTCSSAAMPNGSACDDGQVCTVSEYCTGSSCGGGTANTCNDGDVCTLDTCDPIGGCGHAWQYAQSGCCKPTLWQTACEGDGGNGITTSVSGASPWSIGQTSKTHAGVGGMAVTSLSGAATAIAKLPSFTLPTGTTSLAFWLYFDAVSANCTYATFYTYPCGSASFQVNVNGVVAFTQTGATNGWTQVTLNTGLLAGTTPVVTLMYSAQNNANYGLTYSSTGTGVFVDDIQVTSTCQ